VSSLAVDVGGTFIKAAVIDDGHVGPVSRVPIPPFLDSSGEVGELGYAREIDASALDAAVHSVISSVSAGANLDGRVFVSGQMAGLAFIDESGAAAAPLISWQDTRYGDVAAVESAIGSDAVADLGDGVRVGSPVVTLAAHPRPSGCRVTSLLAYLAGRIAGGRAMVVHATDAASWGLLDVRHGEWSKAACRVAGVDPALLPRVTRTVDVAVPGTGVRVAIGDQQASLLGAGLEPGWVSVNLATGCQVSVLADEFSQDVQTRPYFGSDLGGRYLHTVTHLPAGRLLTSSLITARGSEDWEWLAGPGMELLDAVGAVIAGISEAAARLGALGRPVLFSGGLIQRLPALHARIAAALGASDVRVFEGDDAALAGLARLADR
jgi:sugar (pentulose or hexulose) kinase